MVNNFTTTFSLIVNFWNVSWNRWNFIAYLYSWCTGSYVKHVSFVVRLNMYSASVNKAWENYLYPLSGIISLRTPCPSPTAASDLIKTTAIWTVSRIVAGRSRECTTWNAAIFKTNRNLALSWTIEKQFYYEYLFTEMYVYWPLLRVSYPIISLLKKWAITS